MPQLTQQKRRLEVATPLGPDVLVLKGFTGTEQLSRLFSFQLEMVSEQNNIDYRSLLGQNVTWRVDERFFNGFVSRIWQAPSEGHYARYWAEIVPWLWFLGRTSDCRIFQEKSIPQIIEQIFADFGFTHYRLSLTGSYSPLEYCVQYRETALNYICRLAEWAGIFFYCEHENGQHNVVFADANNQFAGPMEVEMTPAEGTGPSLVEPYLTNWEHQYGFRSGKWAQRDYNFKEPRNQLLTNENTVIQLPQSYELYDYPGEYMDRSEGQTLTKIRMEEEETKYSVVHGQGAYNEFSPGLKINLTRHENTTEQGEYVLTSVDHSAQQWGLETDEEDEEFHYGNSFTAIPSSQQYRPPRITPKPRVRGAQTAVVTGPSGEEIYTDEYARVKCQFHWDREGQHNERTSCWIRVSQPWAGKNWGGLFNPRIGQEVIVDFLEGDPDRPVIVGRVYNAECMPPYELPGNQTRSTFKSRTSPGGGGFNELRFEDKAGSEQIFLHAQKDMDVRVKNDWREWIGNERHLIVKKDQKELIEGARHLEVQQEVRTKTGGDYSLDIGGNHQEKVAQNYNCEAGFDVHLKGGTKLVLEAGTQLSLKVGGNFVDIGPAGVTIVGTMVKINSGGAAGTGAGASPQAPEPPDEADDGSKGTKM